MVLLPLGKRGAEGDTDTTRKVRQGFTPCKSENGLQGGFFYPLV